MSSIRPALAIMLFGVFAGACSSFTARKEIEGNNTGGIIPPALSAGGNAQVAANAHCAKWNTTARITFSGADAGGDTIFVCETAAGPAVMGAPIAPSAPPPAPALPPAQTKPPVKR